MALPQDTTDAVFKKLLSLPENKTCVDCGKTNPKWASATFGVFLCLECSALHRSMGVHISFVRSCELDEWHHEQVSRMALGGNSRATSFFRARGAGSLRGKAKYTSKAADAYKKALDKAAADTPIDLKQYGGGGTTPATTTTASAFDDFEWEDTIPVTPPLPVTPPSSITDPSPSTASVSPPRTATASASHTLTYHGGDAPAKSGKKGVKKVSSDFFDDFDAESSSEEEPVNTRPTPSASAAVEPVRQSFSRLQFEETGRASPASASNARRTAPAPKPAPKADAAHSHTLWDDDDDFPSSGSAAKKSVYGGHSGSSSRGGGRSTYGNTSSYGGSGGYGNDYSSSNSYSSNNYSANNYSSNGPSANSYGGSNTSNGGRRGGSDFFDDDDDWGSSRAPPRVTKSAAIPREEGYAKKQFAESSAISSDAFFGKKTTVNNAGPKASDGRFAGATAISSAQYYDRDESAMAAARMQQYDNDFDVDLDAAKETVLKVGATLSKIASEWMDDWGSY